MYRPQADTWLLADALRTASSVRVGARVLDAGTGTGVLALPAARASAEVLAVDISRRAVLAARVNARLRRLPIRVQRGDLFELVRGQVFDVVVANLPYVSSDCGYRRRNRTWDGGPDGRAFLDRLCTAAPRILACGGRLLVVQSALAGVLETIEQLRSAGLKTTEVGRAREKFGRLMRGRAERLEATGAIGPGQRYEELVVIRAESTN
ncbi:HemK2/MTQ2 family protein methyltransferase [Actinoallomurus acaciae]|uniref:HemK2/MTQ2 family protein methyltransferase n=1 Tax=Actinoallomurus acaciae TaxID=502577 RepID=A0ABV5YA95_9ACTN